MRNVLLAGVAALSAGPALASDLPTKKPPPPALVVTEYDWTGVYFGANLGWEWGRSNFTSFDGLAGAGTDLGVSSSFIGGAQVGYRYLFPSKFVIGGEVSLDGNARSSNTSTNVVGYKYYEWSTSSSGFGGNVVAIGGYAFGDLLPYVKGGVAWIDENLTLTQVYSTFGNAAFGTSKTIVAPGWTLGAGLAYHFWSNWEVFGQYAYMKFGPGNIDYAAALRTSRASLTVNSITAGVNYKF